MLGGRTSDGVSTTLCGVGLFPYGTWLGLAAGIGGGLYALLVVSSCFAVAQAALALRYTRGSPVRMLIWLLAATGSGLLALHLPWAAVLYVAPLDLVWYGRAIRDVVRSVRGVRMGLVVERSGEPRMGHRSDPRPQHTTGRAVRVVDHRVFRRYRRDAAGTETLRVVRDVFPASTLPEQVT